MKTNIKLDITSKDFAKFDLKLRELILYMIYDKGLNLDQTFYFIQERTNEILQEFDGDT